MSSHDAVRDAVVAELVSDPQIDASHIRVLNIRGDVALHGTVPSYAQRRSAAGAVRRVRGVTRVHDRLAVDLPEADVRDEAQLTTAANLALQRTVTLPPGVDAVSRNGHLTLFGTVPFASQRTAAEDVVSVLTGVVDVDNRIDVQGPVDVLDLDIRIRDALGRHALVADDSVITTHVDAHAVTLSGHVRTLAEHDAVLTATWTANGVWEVRDDLVVTG